jgi:enoyl-[acyl-carrier protein] reductase II
LFFLDVKHNEIRIFFMKTKITKLFGIQYPIILSGMTGVSTPELVASVSNAGGLGIIATGNLNTDEIRKSVKAVKLLTNKPFGANVPLLIPGARKKAEVLFQEEVPVVNYSLGKGDWLVKKVHQYGGKVIATVVTHKHAKAAERDGADALIVTGHEAAAHGGAVTSLVLTPSIASAVTIPVIAAGGFADGKGLAAALALNAEGVAMGTRFMNTMESPVHENMKRVSIERTVHDTVYSDRIDGIPCRAMKSPGTERLVKSRFVLFRALFNSRDAAKAYGFPWLKLTAGILFAGYRKAIILARMANAFKPIQLAMSHGDSEQGVLLLGQVTGIVEDTPTVSVLIERIVQEAGGAAQVLADKLADPGLTQKSSRNRSRPQH